MKKSLVLLTAFAAFAVFAAGVSVAEYPYCKTAEFPAERPAFFLIPLDGEIYRHTEPEQSDLRIVSPSGEAVPYAIFPLPSGWKTAYSFRPVEGRIVGFAVDRAANVATIEYEFVGMEKAIALLRLRTADRDFDKSVSLEFDNGVKTEKFRFFDHGRNVGFRNDEFRFPPQSARRIRIRIHNFAEKRAGAVTLEHKGEGENFTESQLLTRELRLEKISFCTRTETIVPDPGMEVLRLPELSREKKGDATVLRLSGERRKVMGLRIGTTTPNYLREVEVRAILRRGNAVTTDRRFTQKIMPGTSEIPLGGSRADEYAVTIRNGDDPELAELAVSARCEQEALLIEGASAPTGAVKILYGSGNAEQPRYGVRKYVANFCGREWKAVTVSAEAPNPGSRRGPGTGNFFRGAIGWIIAAAAAILAVLAWKSFSRIAPEKE